MKRITLAILSFITITTALNAQEPTKDKPKTAGEIDLDRFKGTWYEIGRLPNALEKNLTGVTVVYVPSKNKIKETFIGYNDSLTGKQKRIKSKLTYEGDGVIKGPLGGTYYVLAIGPAYEYFMMGTENRDYLWIMSRKKEMDNPTYNSLLSKAADQGYESTKVETTKWK